MICYCCLPYNHCSNRTWVVEESLSNGNRVRSTHCREFSLLSSRRSTQKHLSFIGSISLKHNFLIIFTNLGKPQKSFFSGQATKALLPSLFVFFLPSLTQSRCGVTLFISGSLKNRWNLDHSFFFTHFSQTFPFFLLIQSRRRNVFFRKPYETKLFGKTYCLSFNFSLSFSLSLDLTL